MNYSNHNIMLSGEAARNFYRDMTHIDYDNQARINAFMAEINSNIALHEDEDTIAATVKNINVDKITQFFPSTSDTIPSRCLMKLKRRNEK